MNKSHGAQQDSSACIANYLANAHALPEGDELFSVHLICKMSMHAYASGNLKE